MQDAGAHRRYEAATAKVEPPFAIVDLAAFRANAEDLVRRSAGLPIRVASKSIRCRRLLSDVLAMPGFAGVMAFTLPEALWLSETDTSDDILVAYPTADRQALARLAGDPVAAGRVTLMVDAIPQLDLIDAATRETDTTVKVCIDIDTSWQPLGAKLRVGAHRSPVRSPEHAAALAREIDRRPRLQLDGLMAYEAQIAGVGDTPPGRPLYGRVLRGVQERSRHELARRRAAIVAAVREVTSVRFVNGGGTGSLHTTSRERAVTELAAGSGLYQPRLFDHYQGVARPPAALFALPVVRRPAPGVATVLGGGYLASGPGDAARLPEPYYPPGLDYSPTEGAGEVQTPLRGAAANGLAVGDRVWLRHAKAGELCERFATLYLVEGQEIVDTVPTYRGEGQTFL